jgi:hypothetical protein
MLRWLSKEFLIAVIISLSIVVIVLSLVHPPIQNRQPPLQQLQQRSEQTQGDHEAAYDNSFSRIINKALDDPVVGLTGGILIVNFFLVLAVIGQIREARRSSERQLRAYLTTTIGESFRQGGGVRGLKLEFRPRILNTGQTPAYEVRVLNTMALLNPAEALTYNFQLPENPPVSRAGSVMTLGPGQERFTHVIAARKMTRTEMRDFISNRKTLYVYGTICYVDAFKKRRFTNFCYWIGYWNKRIAPLWHNVNRHYESD